VSSPLSISRWSAPLVQASFIGLGFSTARRS
jgi:hypothetical protein